MNYKHLAKLYMLQQDEQPIQDSMMKQEGITKELQQLANMNVWIPAKSEDIPPNAEIIPARLIHRPKKDSTGRTISIKSRVVAGGHRQGTLPEHLTAVPTIYFPTLLLMLQLSLLKGLDIATFDIAGAYLHASLNEDIYIKMGGELLEHYSNLFHQRPQFMKLMMSLYGLKQSGKNFYDHLTQILKEIGYTPSNHDAALFINSTINSYLCLHVDDILVIGNIQKVKEHLIKSFTNITEEDVTHQFNYIGMSIEIIPNKTNGYPVRGNNKEIRLNFNTKIKELLNRHNVARIRALPYGKDLLINDQTSPQLNEPEAGNYLSTVMSLMFISKL
jgi:hypothetical protein